MGLTKDIKRYLKSELSRQRYDHTLNVKKTATELAERHLCFGSDKARKRFLKKIRLAALLHDADKAKDQEELKKKLADAKETLHREFEEFPEVWHAYAAALTAQETFGIDDPDLLAALRYHTTGRAGMSPLEKIIYLADYIEPGRDFPGLDEIRQAARQSLDLGCLKALEHSMAYLSGKGIKISPHTANARKDLLKHGNF